MMTYLSKRRTRRLSSRAAHKATVPRLERMERRLVLAAAVSWNPNNGFLNVYDASGGTQGIYVKIYSSNGWTEVADLNGVYWDGSQHNCAAVNVTSIEVDGSISVQNGDYIDLNGVNATDFPNISRGSVVVYGYNGNDTVDLGWAGERAYGGFGNDSLVGGSGPDTIYGGNGGNGTEGGYDYIYGAGGNDYLVAESTAGAQRYNAQGAPIPSSSVYGGDGNDFITDGDALDYLSGDAGDDVIVAGNGGTRILGDVIDGGAGDDTITGTSQWDWIDGGDGDDTVNGNGGDGTPANSDVGGGGGNNYLNPPDTNPPTPNDYGTPTGSHPQVNGLAVSAATVPQGGKLTLTAQGVGIVKPFDGVQQNIIVTQVTFWLDSNNNGVLDQAGQNGGDTIVGTVPVNNNKFGNVSYTINPVNLAPGTYKFFAIAQSSAGFEGNYWFNTVDVVKNKVKVNGTSDATEVPATDGLVTIEREGPNDFDLTVNFSTSDSDMDGDYTVSPSPDSIVIPAGQSQAVVHITPIDDQIVESPAETVHLSIESGDYYDIDTPAYGDLTIQEDTEPTFTVSAPSSVSEGGNLTYTITRTGETSGSVTVYFSYGGSASEGTDYTTSTYSVVFADGQTTQTVSPTLLDDQLAGEEPEDLSLSLEPDDHYVIGSPGYADVAIEEDTEPTFTVSASPSSVAEGGGVTFTITRSGEMTGSVTVYFSWGGLAAQGSDYTVPGYSVVFGDQQATATVTPTLLDDNGYGEPDVDLSLNLEADNHYDVGSPNFADVSIVEDDDSGGSSLMLNLPPRETVGQPASITPAQIRPFLQAATHEWEAAGVDSAFIHRRLAGASIHVADLPGSLLGETTDDEIWLDGNAAGYGWFIGGKRKDGGAFAVADGPTERIALPGSPAYGHVDLLTAVTHEVGHLLGLPDLPPGVEPQDIMALAIGLSTCRFPAPGEGQQRDSSSARLGDSSPDAAFADFAGVDWGTGTTTHSAGSEQPPIADATLRTWPDIACLDEPSVAHAGVVGAKRTSGFEADR